MSDQREIYLGYTCFESSRAHWFLYIPSLTKTSLPSFTPMGKVIQVTGNPFTGFGFQVKLNHNAAQQPDTHYLSLGSVPANAIIDDYKPNPLSGPELRDRPVPGDRLEHRVRSWFALPRSIGNFTATWRSRLAQTSPEV